MDKNSYKAPQNRWRITVRVIGTLCMAAFVILSLPPQAYTPLAVGTVAIALSTLVGLVGAYFALQKRRPRR